TQEGPDYFSGKIQSLAKVGIGHTWEARVKFNCLSPGCWPSVWLVNEEPLPDGEVDLVEWYGNGKWAPGSTVHARSDGKTWAGRDIPGLVDAGWHTWRVQWTDTGFRFSRDGNPYLSVPAAPIKGVWPFNQPDYLMSTLFSLAVGGPGGGDPALGRFPSTMLVDWIHIW
ncbi:MAG: family 16 glycosylhydrolase, partial [Mycolicibacterium sp.]|nr:family 16 glycosylhydrolase [Mycolicibacterium sp.]